MSPKTTDFNNWFIYMSRRNALKEGLTEDEKEACERDAWGLSHLITAIKKIGGSRKDAIHHIIINQKTSPKENGVAS